MIHSRLRPAASRRGFALVTVLLMTLALSSLAVVYFVLTNVENATTTATRDSSIGFSAAEGGLNLRGRDVRATFVDFQRPSGTSPTSVDDCIDADGSNDGADDFACQTVNINGRDIHTYVVDETAAGPIEIGSIREGQFAGLSAQEYRYTVVSEALDDGDETEARLRMVFRSRLVPLFQFAVFYENDVSFHNGPRLDMDGRVHSNGNIFFGTNNGAYIDGTVTAAGDIFVGQRRDDGTCGQNLNGKPGAPYKAVIRSAEGSRLNLGDRVSPCFAAVDADVEDYEGTVRPNVADLTIPDTGATASGPGGDHFYWNNADLRVVLILDSSNELDEIQVQNVDGSEDGDATSALAACGSAETSDTFYDHSEREGGVANPFVRMLEIDIQDLLDCIDDNTFEFGLSLSDSSHGGLVFFFAVDGPRSDDASSLYGVRVRNGSQLASTDSSAPDPLGLTVVTDQAMFIHGDYNTTDWIPAAFIADSLSVLSEDWRDVYDCANANGCNQNDRDVLFAERDELTGNQTTISRDENGDGDSSDWDDRIARLDDRQATSTTINAALLGRNGDEEPGVHNGFIKQHERWSGDTLTIRGSFVSVGTPQRATGAVECCDWQYSPPQRDFNFDTRFRDAANLPPLSPRFVYLVQELFLRDYQDSAAFGN